MKSFKIYFEQNELATTFSNPRGELSADSLEELLQRYEGMTVKQALDEGHTGRGPQYLDLLLRNTLDSPSGLDILNMSADEANNLQDFIKKLILFLLKDVRRNNMVQDISETDEFKRQHNYDDYLKAKDIAIAKRKKMRDEMFAAKDAGDREKYEELRREITSTIRDWEMETEYGKASSQAYKEKQERGRELQFNTPITDEFLKDDGSDYYGDLADAAAKIGIKSSKVIDV